MTVEMPIVLAGNSNTEPAGLPLENVQKFL